jgi:hypothetical protein
LTYFHAFSTISLHPFAVCLPTWLSVEALQTHRHCLGEKPLEKQKQIGKNSSKWFFMKTMRRKDGKITNRCSVCFGGSEMNRVGRWS